MANRVVSPRYAWSVLALLTLLNVVNFVDRQLVLSLQVPLKKEPLLQLNDFKIQILGGYAFTVVYAIAGLYLGSIADRWHRPRLIAVGLFVWSAMTAACGLAQSFWHFAAARVFVAIGEATLTPAAIALLGDLFSPKQRSLASGLYYLGIPIGASLSLIVAGVLEPHVGWRGCYYLLGLVGVVLVATVGCLKDPRHADREPVATSAPTLPVTPFRQQIGELFQTLRRRPALIMTMVGAVAINIGVGATLLDPSWLVAERNFQQSKAPLFLGVILLFGGSLGNFLGGWLGDLFHRYARGGRLVALVCLHLLTIPFGILFRFVSPDSLLFPLGWFVSSMSITMMYGPVYATVQDLTPPRIRATMIAFLVIWLNLLGASLGAVLAVKLKEYLGSYTWGIFLTSQISLIAIPLFLFAARRYQQDEQSQSFIEAQI